MPELSALLLTMTLAACPASDANKERTMHIKPTLSTPELKAFDERLEAYRKSDAGIDLNETQYAKTLAEDMPEHKAALDLLQQQVSQYGTAEAKAFFSLNPVLEVAAIAAALPGSGLPNELRSSQAGGLSLETLSALPPARQSGILAVAREALSYHEAQASASRAGVNANSLQADEIRAFLQAYDRHQELACGDKPPASS